MYTYIYDDLPEFAQVLTCDRCGVVPSYTGTCPHCGGKLDA